MSDEIDEWAGQIHTGNCFGVLDDLPKNSVHAVVADGPYGLAFMGQSWDDFEPLEYQRWSMRWAKEALRVLKPGGHLLSFSGTRTYHRMACGVEDAGFTVRDEIIWLYGSGFPKSLDVSKAIDEKLGKDDEREIVGEYTSPENTSGQSDGSGVERMAGKGIGGLNEVTAPATPEAEQWDGFKTCLKPAHEPIVVARKPLSEDTVAENVLQHGTGALNIDDTRIPIEDKEAYENNAAGRLERHSGDRDKNVYGEYDKLGNEETAVDEGRYPSNLCLDSEAARMLDEQSGELTSGALNQKNVNEDGDVYGSYPEHADPKKYEANSGGASRFFYCSKASKAERTLNGRIDNSHPTVKPTDLMTWLVTLVTAEDQIVLDPFAGSGTTCKAAKDAGRRFIGIEKNPEYADIARARCGLKPADPEILSGDGQSALSTFVQEEQAHESG